MLTPLKTLFQGLQESGDIEVAHKKDWIIYTSKIVFQDVLNKPLNGEKSESASLFCELPSF